MLSSLLRYAEIQGLLALGSSILLLILSAYSLLIPSFIWSWVSSSYLFVLLYFTAAVVLTRWCARGGQCSEILAADLEGQTFLVTGAGGGIGKETAKELAKRGARVVLFARPRNLAEAISDVKRVARSPNNVVGYPIDLSDLRSIRSCAEELLKTEKE